MNDLWFISDTHFGHSNILSFTNYDGDKVRPEFKSSEEMDEIMVERWNEVIKPTDKVYHLGDVAWDVQGMHRIFPRLNGHKRLILGNHDKFAMNNYLRHFDKVMESWQPVRNILFTHRPVMIADKVELNVHGHVHRTRGQVSSKHFNISVEMTDYRPIHWDEIIKQNGITYDGRS